MLFSRAFRPDVVHVEATSRTSCRGGLHVSVGYPGLWTERDLDLYHFELLLPVMRKAAVVQFAGWGDPLLHPRILEMVRLAKALDKYVTLATAGEPLDLAMADKLVDMGLDSISLIIAGLDEESNRRRRGTSLNAATEAARAIGVAKRKKDAARPRLNLGYTLAASGMGDLPNLTEYAASINASSVTVGTLSFSTCLENEDEALVPEDEESFADLVRELEGPANKMAELGIAMRSFAVYGGIASLNCPEAPWESVFVRSDGGLCPCSFTGLPLSGQASYWFRKRPSPYPDICYGLAGETDPRLILADQDWRTFRREFASGVPPEACAGCWRPFMVSV